MGEIRAANPVELQFNRLASEKLYELSREIKTEEFWEKSPEYRFYRYNKMYSLYTEITNYKPLNSFIKEFFILNENDAIKIQGELYQFIRNLFAHFPYFDTWDEVWISKEFASWNDATKKRTIHQFLEKYVGHEPLKYRFNFNESDDYKEVTLNFHQTYNDTDRIYLKDLINEKDGVFLSIVGMNTILRELVKQPISE